MKIKVIIDSACDHTGIQADVQIQVAPLIIDIDGNTYKDDSGLNRQEFLSAMQKMHQFNTACPSADTYETLYAGEEDVFVLTISSQLSASYQSAVLAKNDYFEQHGKHKRIHVFDSLSASSGETNVLLKILACIEAGMEYDAIIPEVEQFIQQNQTLFMLQSLANLAKAGRVSHLIATASSALNIRCLMGSDGHGKIALLSKTIGEKRCLKLFAQKIQGLVDNVKHLTLCISHCEAAERVETLLSELSDLMDLDSFKEIIIQKTNGLSTLYAGFGGIVVGVVKN